MKNVVSFLSCNSSRNQTILLILSSPVVVVVVVVVALPKVGLCRYFKLVFSVETTPQVQAPPPVTALRVTVVRYSESRLLCM